MKKCNFIAVFLFFATVLSANAQADEDWLTNTMFSSGKINVVIAVITVVFILLIIYLIAIDRKLKRIENKKTEKVK